ncbi:MAG TPA: hypothetical protein VN278_08060 [Methanosarcina sp.]|nr:hypothetical protein [Methanosarcina sp.]
MINYSELQDFSLSTLYGKFSDSTYAANLVTTARHIEERLAFTLLGVLQLKNDAEWIEYDDEEIEDYFREEMQGIQGKVSGIETNIASLTEEIELFTDTMLGTLIGHIDEQFRMMREDFLIERGKL